MLLLFFLTSEGWKKRDASILFGNGLLQEITDGGQKVVLGTGVIGVATCIDRAWPVGHGGRPYAAFVKVAFVSSERAIGIPELGLMTSFEVSSVVRGEEDKGIL